MGCLASSPGRVEKGDVVRSRADRTRTGKVKEDDGTVRRDRVRVRWDDTGDVSDWLGSRDVAPLSDAELRQRQERYGSILAKRKEEERKKREDEERKRRKEEEERKKRVEEHKKTWEEVQRKKREEKERGQREKEEERKKQEEAQRKTREEEERKNSEEEERKKREEEKRKKLEEEEKEREMAGQALVEAAKRGKLPEITSILTRWRVRTRKTSSITRVPPDAQDLINYMHEGKESARCIYAASSVWWAARHGHLKTLEGLIAAGADVNLAPRVLHNAVPASVRITGAVGEKAARLNGVYDAVIDVDSYVQLNGKPALRKRDDPDTWLFFNTGKLWVIGTTADKEANCKSCLCQGWHSAVAKFDEKTGAVATCLGQDVMVVGVVGNKKDVLNGAYEPTGNLYNGKPLFRKRNDPGGTCEWLRFADGKWRFSNTACKDANNVGATCFSLGEVQDLPTQVAKWYINGNEAEDKWEVFAPMKCIVAPDPVVVGGVVGKRADDLNGVYEPTGDLHNGKPLFRKRNDPGGTCEWLRFADGHWRFSDTACKDINNIGATCFSLGEVHDLPTQVAKWTIIENGAEKFGEAYAPMKCIVAPDKIIVGCVVGKRADDLNGVYEPTGDLHNGKPLFRKRNDPGGLCEWLRFADGNWRFSDTACKDINNIGATCVSLGEVHDLPTQVVKWTINGNGAEKFGEAYAPMKCIVHSVLDRPTAVNSWAIHSNSTQDTVWKSCASMQCAAMDKPAQDKDKLKVRTSEGDKELGTQFTCFIGTNTDTCDAS
jgi:hypothetical protein